MMVFRCASNLVTKSAEISLTTPQTPPTAMATKTMATTTMAKTTMATTTMATTTMAPTTTTSATPQTPPGSSSIRSMQMATT